MKKTILVIEDERSIQNIIKAFLENEDYAVLLADDGASGVSMFYENKPDLVLLDLMLPKIDGFTVCELIRKESSVPIIMLTALDDMDSQIKGFEALADDYITKPFSMLLVVKRIEAILRRSNPTDSLVTTLKYRDISLNTESYEVYSSGQLISLTAREFEILRLFMENPGRVYTREILLNIVWNYDFFGDEKIVNTHIKNIRKKLGVNLIQTIRGVGYRLDKEDKR